MDYSNNIGMNSGWNDLEGYGIYPLTGESCAYSLRLLCDVSDKGKEILSAFFGGVDILGANWNSGNTGDHTGSIMLPYSILPDLKVFVLFKECNCMYAVTYKNGDILGTSDEETMDMVRKHHPDAVISVNYNHSTDDRNVHQFTGRTV